MKMFRKSKILTGIALSCGLIFMGTFLSLSAREKSSETEEHKCSNHECDSQKESQVNKNKQEERFSFSMTARESEKMMKEQEEFCSRPFREFLEEFEKSD